MQRPKEMFTSALIWMQGLFTQWMWHGSELGPNLSLFFSYLPRIKSDPHCQARI